jgi:uncharacterized protein YdaL
MSPFSLSKAGSFLYWRQEEQFEKNWLQLSFHGSHKKITSIPYEGLKKKRRKKLKLQRRENTKMQQTREN